MITLITGLPGNGKTLYVVDYIIKVLPERHVIAINFTDLQIEGVEQRDDVHNWNTYPTGSLVVVDEFQDYAQQRIKDKAPEWITEFSTHRHKGLDFIFITQHPSLLDTWIRRLVQEHIHFVRHQSNAEFSFKYTAKRLIDVDKKIDLKSKDVNKSNFKYPKEVYGKYKSADAHTVKKTIPKNLIKGIIMLMIPLPFVYLFVKRIYLDKIEPEQTEQHEVVKVDTNYKPDYTLPKDEKLPRIEIDYSDIRNYVPEPNMPWSAPIYADHIEVQSVPRITGCVHTPEFCNCYTQQGTKAYVTQEFCKSYHINGGYFDFQKPDKQKLSANEPL